LCLPVPISLLPLLTLLVTYQLASEDRPCTPQAARMGGREWPVEQHWVAAGGEGGGRAEEFGW
jgi:hypothetical protein